MNDTDYNINKIYRKMLMSLSGEKRMLMSFSMFDLSAKLMLCSIRKTYPKKELRKQVFLRLYGNDFKKDEIDKILLSIK
ncbi:MAG: hypothetical protein M1409_10040 [Actinobacteria bacterium]|nr:hypothetical protein [Actinomycetota bacterium]